MADQNILYPDLLWAGSEHSLEIARQAYASIMAGMFDGRSQGSTTDEEQIPYLFSSQGDQGQLGVVSIKGPLVNRDSWFNQYAGVTSYSDIRRALIYAATSTNVKSILLDIESGGGAVSGLFDTADLISSISQSIKPIYTFGDGSMASAAYALGSAAGEGRVYVSSSAVSGSIGVIMTHMEYSKQLKEAGVGVNVIRAGKFKALANSVEPLTEPAQKQLQAQIDSAYALFADHVIEMRGTTPATFASKMGEGREFFGAAAVDAGLADGVKTFDTMVSMILSKEIDTNAKKEYSAASIRGTQMTRQALTEQRIAAIASGAATVDPAVLAAATAATAATTVTPTDKTEATVVVAADTTAVAAAKPTDTAVLTYVQGQLAAANTELTAKAVELAAEKTKLASIEASLPTLKKIVAQSLSNMRVAMGGAKVDLSSLAPEALLAEHSSTEAAFVKFLPAGQVSAAKTGNEKEETTQANSDLRAARLAATRFGNTK